MPVRAAKIEIPRWIQLAGLPVVLLFLWIVAGAVRHVVFLFLVALLIALLLSPVVRGVQRVRMPRGFAVALVYLVFAVTLIAAIGALGTVVVNETKTAAKRVDSYFTDVNGRTGQVDADRDVDRLQHWFDTHRLGGIDIQQRGHRLVRDIRKHDVGKYTDRVVNFLEGAAISIGKLLFSAVVILVVSIYMLLDFPKFERKMAKRFPPHPGSDSLLLRMERSLTSYVKGQALVSLIIGTSAGVGLWLFGVLGWLPHGQKYALLFGAWVAITELIPYLGPWLGSIPPVLYAVVVHPISAVWVILLFLAIHQVEGHIVVPNVMGSALRLHPLLVIFGLLAGGEIYGLPGALVALPLLAAGRAMWEFFAERVDLEPWQPGEVAVPVEVELEQAEPPPPAAASR
ncbi:MAG: AI-2E family transporter [Actinobacteria bacterium]|nr:MAG: AI-2E family transporter [Actinomycetota bacterium]